MKSIATIGVILALSASSAAAQVVITGEATVSSGDGSTAGTASGTATVDGSAGVAISPVPPPPATGTAGMAMPPPDYHEPVAEIAPPPGAPNRVFGLGTAFGGGIAGAGAYTTALSSSFYVGPAIELPTLEALIFFNDHISLDITIPLWNTIVLAAFAGFAPWATNFLLDFSIGDDWVRFIVGPEVGFSYVGFNSGAYSFNSTQINVGALVGVELLSRSRLFGFRVMSRPSLGIAFTSASSDAVAIGGTALLEIGLISYFTDG